MGDDLIKKRGRKLSSSIKNSLAQKVLENRLKKLDKRDNQSNRIFKKKDNKLDQYCRFDQFSGYQKIQIMENGSKLIGLSNPFFKVHDKTISNKTWVNGKEYINYANYDYLGFASEREVQLAAKQAIDEYGTSVSASRIMSGERLIHRELESELASA